MAFTVEPINDTPAPSVQPIAPMAPDKQFVGFDPKGTTTVTGDTRIPPNAPVEVQKDLKQPVTPEGETGSPGEGLTLSPKISALARKEQAQRKREFELAQREKAIEADLADARRYREMKAKLGTKDFSAAEAEGLSYEEYSKWKVDQLNSQDPAEQRFKKVESELEAFKKAQEENVIKEYQANQALWKQEIAKIVDQNDEFKAIKKLGMYDEVLRHINDSFDEDGTELTAEQAAKEIEEEFRARAKRYSSVFEDDAPTEAPKVLGPPKANVPTGITNEMAPSSQVAKPKPFHLLSESEQIAEAIRRVEAEKLKRMQR